MTSDDDNALSVKVKEKISINFENLFDIAIIIALAMYCKCLQYIANKNFYCTCVKLHILKSFYNNLYFIKYLNNKRSC